MLKLYLRGLDVTLKENTDGHLNNSLDTSALITVNLVHADIVLTIAGGGERTHDGKLEVEYVVGDKIKQGSSDDRTQPEEFVKWN